MDKSTTFESSDFRSTVRRFSPENRKANQMVLDIIAAVAERKGVTPAQIALAWVLAPKPWIVPISGTMLRHRLEGNVQLCLVEGTESELQELDTATSRLSIQGERYAR
ncbi:aldo/keto reductase [bacterium]|nr:aldo/keto reductase [bacterium]